MPGHKIGPAVSLVLNGLLRSRPGPLRDLRPRLSLKVGRYVEEELDLMRIEAGEVNVEWGILVVWRVSAFMAVEWDLTI